MKALLVALCFLSLACTNRQECAVDAPPPEPETPHIMGEKLFKANCTGCHTIQGKLVGPALADYGDSLSTAFKFDKTNHNIPLTQAEVDSIGVYIRDYKMPMPDHRVMSSK